MQQQSEPRTPTILIVDDAFENLHLMQSILKSEYKVKVTPSGERALAIADSGQPLDLILLDIEMPIIDGYEVIKRLKADPKTASIPVVFISAKGSMNDEQAGLELGAVDYISKPISPPILMARVKTHIASKRFADLLRDKNLDLEEEVERRTQEMTAIQDATIMAIASLAEAGNCESSNHLKRTPSYVRALAWRMVEEGKHAEVLTPKNIALMFKAVPLHDIGKVGIPDRILLKREPLTPEEAAVMETHTTLGRDALAKAEASVALDLPFFTFARQIACSHHERWDGTGYPEALSGESIPIAARLMALADMYDDLTSGDVRTKGVSHEDAVRVIADASGKQLDPEVVQSFMAINSTIKTISESLTESAEEVAAKRRYYALAHAA
jgi:putative two-component system response regulator